MYYYINFENIENIEIEDENSWEKPGKYKREAWLESEPEHTQENAEEHEYHLESAIYKTLDEGPELEGKEEGGGERSGQGGKPGVPAQIASSQAVPQKATQERAGHARGEGHRGENRAQLGTSEAVHALEEGGIEGPCPVADEGVQRTPKGNVEEGAPAQQEARDLAQRLSAADRPRRGPA